jgi:hypothetical protein
MKQIVRLRPGHFIHLDSYGSTEPKHGWIPVFVLSTAIAALTAGALLGTDITNTTQQDFNNTHRITR